MTLQQFDDVLKLWRGRLSAMAENLLELQTETTFQALTGTGGLEAVAVTGATAARVQPALRRMNGLFEQFGRLESTIERAEALRAGLPALFGADAKARELQQLLFGPSIEGQAATVPLAERGLLSGVQASQRLTPEQLLERMTEAFADVRDAVAAAGRAWTDFADQSERAERELSRLRTQSAIPTAVLAPALDAVDAKLASARAEVRTDPFGALRSLTLQVEPALAAASQRVTAAEAISRELGAARARWETLHRGHVETVAALAEAARRTVVTGTMAGAVPEEKMHGIGEWLTRLERKREEGALDPVRVGLRNWAAAAEACLAQDRAALSACQTQLAARGELRGRLDALKAKARAYGLAEGGEVAALGGAAEQVLYTQPIDLTRAAAAVARYEESLRGARLARVQERSVGSR